MPQPSSSLATQRPDLSSSLEEFDLAADRQGFIAHRVLPELPVAQQAGTFGRIPVEQLLQHPETRRAPGAVYNSAQWKFETDSYATEEHGWVEFLDDREVKMYANYFDAELVSTKRAQDFVLRNRELRVRDLLMAPGTYNNRAVAVPWSEPTCTPLDDVEAAIRAFWEQCGLWPNFLAMSKFPFRNLRFSEQILERAKYNGIQDVTPAKMNEVMLAQMFDIDEVIVAGGTRNTANPAQAAAFATLWPDSYVFVGRKATTRDVREPCSGRIFHWQEDGSEMDGTVETYRDETRRSDAVRVRNDVDEKTFGAQFGYLLTGVTAQN